MKLTRRKLLAAGSATGVGGLLGFLGLDLSPAVAYACEKILDLQSSRITTTICPYCAVGCGALVISQRNEAGNWIVVSAEGDPDHPINEGSLCPKGASLCQLAANNPNRLRKVLYRAPGATAFSEIDWATAARQIAQRIKQTRDAEGGFTRFNAKGQAVNRATAIASVGSAALDNEECWLYQKLLRAMGLVYIEHQARL